MSHTNFLIVCDNFLSYVNLMQISIIVQEPKTQCKIELNGSVQKSIASNILINVMFYVYVTRISLVLVVVVVSLQINCNLNFTPHVMSQ